MEIDFVVNPDGAEPFKLRSTSRDILIWEKGGRGRSLSALLEGISITSLTEIAHASAKRQGLYLGTLAEFETGVDLDFKVRREPDPTQEEVSAD